MASLAGSPWRLTAGWVFINTRYLQISPYATVCCFRGRRRASVFMRLARARRTIIEHGDQQHHHGQWLAGVAMHNHAAPPRCARRELRITTRLSATPFLKTARTLRTRPPPGQPGSTSIALSGQRNRDFAKPDQPGKHRLGLHRPVGSVSAVLNKFTAVTGVFHGGGGTVNAPRIGGAASAARNRRPARTSAVQWPSRPG